MTSFGVAARELPDSEYTKYARINSAMAGAGKGFSMIFGTGLYSYGGYSFPYLILGLLFILIAIFIQCSGKLRKL